MISNEVENCIAKCSECAKTCLETITHCLQKGGKHATQHHIGMLTNCASLCGVSVKFMTSQSDFQGQLCGLCAEVCESCADDCRHFRDDSEMQRCAEVCRVCAEACREMAPVRKAA